MKNIKRHYFFYCSISLFLFFMQIQLSFAQDLSIGLIGGINYQEIVLTETSSETESNSKGKIGFQFGLRALAPIPRVDNRFKLEFDLLFQKRKFTTTVDSLMYSLTETELFFRPVLVIQIPASINDWSLYGKIGLSTSYALKRELIHDGTSIEFEGFRNLFSAGLIAGVGMKHDDGFFIELSSTANFSKPHEASVSGSKFLVNKPVMDITLTIGWMFGS